jgi:hypothetical protein
MAANTARPSTIISSVNISNSTSRLPGAALESHKPRLKISLRRNVGTTDGKRQLAGTKDPTPCDAENPAMRVRIPAVESYDARLAEDRVRETGVPRQRNQPRGGVIRVDADDGRAETFRGIDVSRENRPVG